MTAWQLIESAPKDGTRVLAWEPHARYPYIAYRDPDDEQWWTDAEEYNDSTRYFPPRCRPTHWMLLPEPPLK